MTRKLNFVFLYVILGCLVLPGLAGSQTYVEAWGNIDGVRVEGQLFPVESSMCVVYNDWNDLVRTAKEKQQPQYDRDGNVQTVTTRIDEISMVEKVTDVETGKAKIELTFKARQDTTMTGAYLLIDPSAFTEKGEIKFVKPKPSVKCIKLDPAKFDKDVVKVLTKGLEIKSASKQLKLSFDAPIEVLVRKQNIDGNDSLRVFLTVMSGNAVKDVEKTLAMNAEVSGDIDHSPVNLAVDVHNAGRVFDGFGGNFRLQNMQTDPTVIFYNLENMRVAWGRVQMPWSTWQPEEDMSPLDSVAVGAVAPQIKNSMMMAKALAMRDIPIIVSAWFPPQWAALGPFTWRPAPGEPRGNALDQDKVDQIYKSIADYLVALKNYCGVEAVAFSFNESDLGINVRQTAEEHQLLIKTLGPYLAKRGLKTKILLGDNSDATTTDFIIPALNDPECLPYIAAVSFHSWRGWSDELLNFWRDASVKLNVPLFLGEGSTDAAAHSYPQMFLEDIFALEEINLYMRIMSICQPKSILQWQLTSDYSFLTGAGIFRTEGPLRTTRRFWNMKHIASSPEGAFHLPIKSDNDIVNSCALGNMATGEYVVHMVNNGAERTAVITGLPQDVHALEVYVTDTDQDMVKYPPIEVIDGKAELTLASAGLTSVFAKAEQTVKFEPIPQRRFGRKPDND